jgi:DNA polymerase V
MKKFALVDCNNFFVSCERIFNPTLLNKPVVVLSSNDACIIARSNEAKALGIPMGIPLFRCQDIIKKHNVIVYSANFALYGDMSSRVMQTLTELATDIEIYSIDEAFIFLPSPTNQQSYWEGFDSKYAYYIKDQIYKNTGIPVTIGIGPTKTLAKIANKIAKKKYYLKNVLDISDIPDIDPILESINVSDIWGIGSRYSRLLKSKGINNARDFKYSCEKWVKKNLTVVGLKTLLEIRGISCLSLNDVPPKKQSITVSRSFGKNVTSLIELKEALATYTLMAAEKLRNQKAQTSCLTVFVIYTHYLESDRFFLSTTLLLPIATSFSLTLVSKAYNCLDQLFKPGLVYKKVGIILSDFVPGSFVQLSTYVSSCNREKERNLMLAMDKINKKLGRNKVTIAAAGLKQDWKMKQAKKSACFTTSWNELLTIKI